MDFLQRLRRHPLVKRALGDDLGDRDLVGMLIDEDLRVTCDYIARKEAAKGSKRDGHDWSRGMPPHLVKQADYLLYHGYTDLRVPLGGAKKAGAELAITVLAGTPKSEAPARFVAALGGRFRCPTLEEFIKENPCGTYTVRTLEPHVLYCLTRFAEAENLAVLEQLKASKKGAGVEIVTIPDDPCRLCRGQKTFYSWKEIEELPPLPRHWGCRCRYGSKN